ncbi:MAG: lipoyl synthase [bacterium]
MIQTKHVENVHLPHGLKKHISLSGEVHRTKVVLRANRIHTVCESARCPNISECFGMHRATFMIMGDICTRACRFCSIDKGHPAKIDPEEPYRIAKSVAELGIMHAVITSVTRDDLNDGGADHFYRTVCVVKELNPDVTVELLTPDFKGNRDAIMHLLEADFEIFNHNVETVPRLYRGIRPQALYERSIEVLGFVKRQKRIIIKSGLMVGLGETMEEVKAVLRDLKEVGCDIVTIGQYLMPTSQNIPVQAYITQELYDEYERFGREIGIPFVYAGPFIRSSYHAQEIMNKLVINPKNAIGKFAHSFNPAIHLRYKDFLL